MLEVRVFTFVRFLFRSPFSQILYEHVYRHMYTDTFSLAVLAVASDKQTNIQYVSIFVVLPCSLVCTNEVINYMK